MVHTGSRPIITGTRLNVLSNLFIFSVRFLDAKEFSVYRQEIHLMLLTQKLGNSIMPHG